MTVTISAWTDGFRAHTPARVAQSCPRCPGRGVSMATSEHDAMTGARCTRELIGDFQQWWHDGS